MPQLPIPPKFAEVAVEVPTPGSRTFTYSIPPAIGRDIGLGSTVVVPFGGRTVLGFAIGFPPESSVESPKDLVAVVDSIGLPAPLIQLCHWIADYYACSLSEAVHLILPPGGARRLRCIVESAAGLDSEGESDPLLVALKKEGGVADTRLLAGLLPHLSTADMGKRLRTLEAGNFITRKYQIQEARIKEAYVKVARIAQSAGDPGRLGPAQQRIVDRLSACDGICPINRLLADTDSGRSPLKQLESKGLVELEDLPESNARILFAEFYSALDAGKSDTDGGASALQAEKKVVTLSEPQSSALAAIDRSLQSAQHAAFVIDGVTGSGKTEIYLRSIERALSLGKGAILLVPEIALTPQTQARVIARFGGDVAVLHSNLGDRERFRQWHRIARGEVALVVGTRSALFAPVRNLGLIIIDEEQEGAYKQGRAPRYHARETAGKLAQICDATLILGTATPTLEALDMVERGDAMKLELPNRVTASAVSPVRIVDMKKEGGRGLLGRTLVRALTDAFNQDQKAVLLINRRGFASFLQCEDCGHVPMCTHCAVSMTFHKREARIKCHHCNSSLPFPVVCPECGGVRILQRGAGTQRAEEEIQALFPDVPIVRMDADSTSTKGSHGRHLGSFESEEGAAILLGTQMIAKGLHFPDVTIAGVLNADSALYLPDFRAAERTYQLITQVAGRAGRGDVPGRVFVQSYNPEHYAIEASATGNAGLFYSQEQEIRKIVGYPPYSGLTSVVLSHPVEKEARKATERLAALIEPYVSRSNDLQLLGPAVAPIERIKGRYRWHFLLKYPAGQEMLELKGLLQKSARSLIKETQLNIMIDVDPAWVL